MPRIHPFDKQETLRLGYPMTRIIIDPDLHGSEKQLIKQYLPAHSYAVVTDDNTHRVLGKRVLDALSATAAHHISLGKNAKATLECAEHLRKESARSHAIIAVGSGTINDMCKYAAHLDGKPYAVFATAPSMNGYISASASLAEQGVKRSFACSVPQALLCDLRVLSAAPSRLILSGLGDSLCRPTAQADWLLSHLLLGTPFTDAPFLLTSEFEEEVFKRAALLQQGNLESVALLMQTLLASGKGMQVAGGSYPASQGEHLIAHAMEWLHPEHCGATYHGEQIGVLTLLMANLQHKLLTRRTPPQLLWQEPPSGWAHAFRRKLPDPLFLDTLNRTLQESWPQVCAAIHPVTLQPAYLRSVLEAAGAPTTVEALGWTRDQVEHAATLAPFMRERFTFLDLAVLSGMTPLFDA